ncbi:prepilin-type N-terminal cleavage/methylation domain-containing protein [Deinococcus aluminii]|uniref:Prepilin-type N-terminal cleavage/methylation domain-containing protein n=1 Tax=Deinococcus aluminii TaxID=1656885 RepID=A0ABP9XHD1_9DEIO
MRHPPPRPSTHGFTLIEVLIGLGLLVALVAGVTVIFPRSTQLVRTSTLAAASNTQVTRSAEQVTQDIAAGQSILQQASQTRLDFLKIQKKLDFETPPGSRQAGLTTVTTTHTDFDGLVNQDVVLANTQGDYLVTKVVSSTPNGSKRTVTFQCPIYLPGNVAAYTFRPLSLAFAAATGESASSDATTLYRRTSSWTAADRALRDVRFAPVYGETNGTFSGTLAVPNGVSGGERLSGIRFVLTGTGEQPVSQASLAGLNLLAVKAWACNQAPGIPARNNGKLQVNVLLNGAKPTTPSGTPSVNVGGPGLTTTLNTFMVRVFENLAPGLYNVNASSFTYGADIYDASVTGSPATVGNGRDATVNVNYTVRKGTAVITVSGLPNGVTGPVTVGGQTFDLPNGTSRVDLQPGAYTVGAGSSAGMNPTVTPASITIRSGQDSAVSVVYASPKGMLNVRVSGLPWGTQGGIHVRGPENRDTTAGNSTASFSLTRGTYTVTADPVSGYVPTVSPGFVNLTSSATISVTYQAPPPPPASTGTLKIIVQGLPSSLQTTASWNGPTSGNQKAGNGTITLTNVPGGTYSVAGDSVGGYSAPSVSITVPSGGTANATLNFTAPPPSPPPVPPPPSPVGTLNIRVTGLFSGVNTTVMWSGPYSGSRSVSNGDMVLSDVPAGTYTVTGAAVSGYTSPAAVTVTIPAGGTGTVTLNYTSQTKLILHVDPSGPGKTTIKTQLTLNGVAYEYQFDQSGSASVTFYTSPGPWSLTASTTNRVRRGTTTIVYRLFTSQNEGTLQPSQTQDVYVWFEEEGDCTKSVGCD